MSNEVDEQLNRLRDKKDSISKSWDQTRNKELLAFFIGIIPRLFDAERCSIFILDPASDRVWLEAGTGVSEKQIEVPKTGSLVGEVISTGQSRRLSDMDGSTGTHRDTDAKTGFVTRTALCVPVRNLAGQQVTGAIQVLNTNAKGGFSEDDSQVLENLGHYLQMSIENVFLNQELLDISEKLNRRLQSVERIQKAVSDG
ncbi:MAG: GAF domain-containing protein [Gammaproteobacteria bacterium]|nr:GAF domain-containing protein [Gammaproteobacteria bacterium]